MLLHRPRPEVCGKYPGIDEDMIARTDVATLVDVQRGRLRLQDAITRGIFVLEGNPVLVRALPSWGGISPQLAAPAVAHH